MSKYMFEFYRTRIRPNVGEKPDYGTVRTTSYFKALQKIKKRNNYDIYDVTLIKCRRSLLRLLLDTIFIKKGERKEK